MFQPYLGWKSRSGRICASGRARREGEKGTDFCQIKKHVILPRVNQKFITAIQRNFEFFAADDGKKVKKNLSDLSDLYLEEGCVRWQKGETMKKMRNFGILVGFYGDGKEGWEVGKVMR
jgi:hypothetical protein